MMETEGDESYTDVPNTIKEERFEHSQVASRRPSNLRLQEEDQEWYYIIVQVINIFVTNYLITYTYLSFIF